MGKQKLDYAAYYEASKEEKANWPQMCVEGCWVPAPPLLGTRLYRFETWCRHHKLSVVAKILAWYDELWLG